MKHRRCWFAGVLLVLGLMVHPTGAVKAAEDPKGAPIPKPLTAPCQAVGQIVALWDSVTITPWSLSGNPILNFDLGLYISGQIPALVWTHDDTLLGYLFKYIDNMISSAVPLTEKDSKGVSHTHLAWTTNVPAPGNSAVDNEKENYTYAAAAQIARAAAMLQDVPQWKTKYASKIQKYSSTVDDMVIQRFYNDKYGGQLPWLNGKVWDERAGWLGGLAASLYHATKNTLYSDIATQIAGAFKARLKANKTGWIWDQGAIQIGSQKTPSTTPFAGDVGNLAGVPDTNGANASVYMMTLAHEEGLAFSDDDMRRMAATLTDTMWNGDSENLVLSNYIDGSNNPFRFQSRPGSNAFLGPGWSLLARYSTTARVLINNVLADLSMDQRATPSLYANSDMGNQTALFGRLVRYPLEPYYIPTPGFTPTEFTQLSFAKYYLPPAHLRGVTLIQPLPISERPASLPSNQYWDTVDTTIDLYMEDYNSRLQHPVDINSLFSNAVGYRLFDTLSQGQKDEYASLPHSIPSGEPKSVQNTFAEEYSNWVNGSSLNDALSALPNGDTSKLGRALFMASFFTISSPTQGGITTFALNDEKRLIAAYSTVSRTSQVLTLGSFEFSLQGNTIVAARRLGGEWIPINDKNFTIPASLIDHLPQAPSATITAVVSAASFQAGPVAPASYVTILGNNLSGDIISVTFNGIAGTVIYPVPGQPSNGTQINLLVPGNLSTSSPAQMVVTIDGQSTTSSVPLTPVSPAIFVPGIVNQDNQVNNIPSGPTVPAPAGSTISAYMTGLFPAGVTGNAVVTAQIGGQSASVQYAGVYPGNIGLDQVNATVPVNTPTGKTRISICVSVPPSTQETCSPPVDLFVNPPLTAF